MMTKKLCLLALALLGAILTGCATSTDMNKIQIGMTKAQVIDILGTPDSTSAQANVEYLTYYLEVNNIARADQDHAYMVRLVDGKVESFGRFLQLFDLYNRPVTNAKPGDPNFPSSQYNPYITQGAPQMGAVVQPMVQVAQPAPAPTDIATQLEKLKKLKDEGVLTDEEFQKAKEKILAEQK